MVHGTLRIAFDVDGTLHREDVPRPEVIELLKALKAAGHYIIVWSGGGKPYAELRCRDFKITEFVDECMDKLQNPWDVDVCFDDMDAILANVNIKI